MHILLLHGLGDDRTAWDSVTDGLRRLGDPTPLTLPGFGGTAPPSGARAEELADLLWQQTPTAVPVVLVGHSAGGVIATLMAELQPARVAGLVNVEGNLTPEDCTFSAAAVAADPFAPWFVRFVDTQTLRYQAALRRCEPEAFRSLAADLVRLSDAGLADRYIALDVPKLFCWGGEYSASSRAALLNAGEAVEDFGTAGHWLMEDRPDSFISVMDRFVASLS